ncbi:MAG: DUF2795 domain-containing protein [Desulfobacterales bacterium]|nr:DUF2795 domain-containing protein [Desulfobacterales bacterium]
MGKKGEGCNYGKPGPEAGHAYGIASVSNALGGVDFPMTKQDLIDRYGDRQIEWTKGNPQALREVLKNAEQDQFGSMADVVGAVSRGCKKHT